MDTARETARPTTTPIRFAGYDLVRQLGRGGTGEVWSAIKRFEHSTRAEAIKVLSPAYSEDPSCREMFMQTSRMGMQMNCANIVPVYEMGEHGGLLYLVMERVDGVSLSQFCHRMSNYSSRFAPHVAAYVLGEILGALLAAHDMVREGVPTGVVHRDVKPGNVLISSTGEVRLTDFGIAMPVASTELRKYISGSPGYMAPEHAQGRACRGSDLFSAGVIFHELVTGSRFRRCDGTTDESWFAAQNYASIPGCASLPNELEYVRRRLLHPDVSRRFESAIEAMEALAKWPDYRFARVDIIKAYQTMIGGRSSGYTEGHEAAKPSFLIDWQAQQADDVSTGRHVSTVFTGTDGATTVRRVVGDPTVPRLDIPRGRPRALPDSQAIRTSRPPVIARPRAATRVHRAASWSGGAGRLAGTIPLRRVDRTGGGICSEGTRPSPATAGEAWGGLSIESPPEAPPSRPSPSLVTNEAQPHPSQMPNDEQPAEGATKSGAVNSVAPVERPRPPKFGGGVLPRRPIAIILFIVGIILGNLLALGLFLQSDT